MSGCAVTFGSTGIFITPYESIWSLVESLSVALLDESNYYISSAVARAQIFWMSSNASVVFAAPSILLLSFIIRSFLASFGYCTFTLRSSCACTAARDWKVTYSSEMFTVSSPADDCSSSELAALQTYVPFSFPASRRKEVWTAILMALTAGLRSCVAYDSS